MAASDRRIAAASAAVDEAAAMAVTAENELAELGEQTEALREIQAQQARHIAAHLTAAHRLAGEDFFKLILNQQSPETFDRMIRYHRRFSAARLQSLSAYQQTLEQLEASELTLRQRAEQAAQLRAEREERQAQLLGERDERKLLIAQLDEAAEDKAIERERLRADQQRLESLMAKLQRKALGLDGRNFAQSQGRLPWPLEGRVLQGFGRPQAEGRLTSHGILIAAPEGSQFRAVQRGRVVFADWLRGFGLLTIIDHGSGYMTLYGHADALSHQVGDSVEAGDILGRAGRSGGQKEPGVYFEIRQNGRARDPAGWLTKR